MQEATQSIHLPESHVASLKQIESGYWWFAGRVYWAERLIREWWLDTPDDFNLLYADLGCGTGGFAREIIRHFEPIRTGLFDGDKNVLASIPRRSDTEVHSIDFNSAFTLPFRPNLVTLMDVMEHVEKDQDLLNQISSQMQRTGMLVLSVPAHQILYSKWDEQLGHYRRYNKKQVTKLLRNAGFEVVRSTYMWSFLAPAAPIRALKQRNATEVNFPTVPAPVNKIMTWLSKAEWQLAKKVGTPFGTSVLFSAVKI